ncbi:hypothetical protein BDW22DRAFT_1353801 [Trametopsis cervina]|nr:hypothetical protein BDW22DRAFT_1353801 [Trametopsis cervina]
MSIILQIPPIDPSASLRTMLLLRLTGDVMGSVTGYHPDVDVLSQLLEWMNDLDRGWLAVLRSQAWDVDDRTGTDVLLGSDTTANAEASARRSTPMSQTDRTRLRSILISGTATMEEWLVELDTAGEGYDVVLSTLGLQQGFDELFAGTLAEMGSLNGAMNMPQGMEGTC